MSSQENKPQIPQPAQFKLESKDSVLIRDFDPSIPEQMAEFPRVKGLMINMLLEGTEHYVEIVAKTPAEAAEYFKKLRGFIGHLISNLSDACFSAGNKRMGNILMQIYLVSQIGQRDFDDIQTMLESEYIRDEVLTTKVSQDINSIKERAERGEKIDTSALLIKTIQDYAQELKGTVA